MANDAPIFVISDLHMGDGGPTDNFAIGDRPAALDCFLDHVEDEKGEIVIVGDLFEFWQASFGKVIMHNLPLLDRLASMRTTYVIGNHDADLCALIGQKILGHRFFDSMCGPFERVIGDKRFKFMHGHEVDPFNSSEDPSWGRMLAIFAAVFERQNGSPVMESGEALESELNKLGELLLRAGNWITNWFKSRVLGGRSPSPKLELTPAQKPDRAAEILLKYAADRISQGYDIAIVGHTHQPGRLEDWYFNTGSWATSNNNFARVSPRGDVELFDWQDGQPVPNDTVLPAPEDQQKKSGTDDRRGHEQSEAHQ